MRKITFLTLFLISLFGYGQISFQEGDSILRNHGVKQEILLDGKSTLGIWEGWCQGIYKTPQGIFIITTEWINENEGLYDIVTYQFHNNIFKRFDLLDGYVIYDYSADRNLFVVRDRPTKGFTITETNGENVYTYDLNDLQSKPKFQYENKIDNATNGKIKDLLFISNGTKILVIANHKNGNKEIKKEIIVK